MQDRAILVLEDGSQFNGISIGASGETSGEVVFNTAMTGYQEILTDPSYKYQMVTLTYPHIGNTGCNNNDEESEQVQAAGLIVRDVPRLYSNWRSADSLQDYLKRNNVVAIADIDTRRLTRILRQKGALSGCIQAGEAIDEQKALAKARAFPGLAGMDLAKVVSCDSQYQWTESVWQLEGDQHPEQSDSRYHVVAYDFGIKKNILRILAQKGCRISVVPATTSASDVLAMKPDGVFLSNGPGDPEPCDYAIEAARAFMAEGVPVFGICLGHQILALASGARTSKMKFGHHGANHPVQDLETGQVMISSQNHGFTVSEEDLPDCLEVTHRSLFDGTIQGIRHKEYPAYSFQGHPEASPGPHDVAVVFDPFISMISG